MKTEHKIHEGHVLDVLKTLQAQSVHCVVTSPPYWGLRDYGTAQWLGGYPECDHLGEPFRTRAEINKNTNSGGSDVKNAEGRQFYKETCGKCGAVRSDKQIGLEKVPDCLAWARGEEPCDSCYVCKMRKVFAEIWRVLRDDGTAWLNLGDSYSNDNKWGGSTGGKHVKSLHGKTSIGREKKKTGLKPKNIMMIPARVALALQSDGWIVRQDIIWHKPNPMPESVRDRCTKSHEYIFLLAKSARYYYDSEAIKEPLAEASLSDPRLLNGDFTDKRPDRNFVGTPAQGNGFLQTDLSGRNKRSVWTVATVPYADAHFATFPLKLIEPCILAGTSEKCCAECATPYRRIVSKELVPTAKASFNSVPDQRDFSADKNDQGSNRSMDGHKPGWAYRSETTGWEKFCKCETTETKPCVVMDCFHGAGTTGIVATKNNRSYEGIELNPEYIEISKRRSKDLQASLF